MLECGIANAALLTHKNCMDGSTCSIAFLAAGGREENIFYSSPNHVESDEKFEEIFQTWKGDIIIADLSVSLEKARSVNPRNPGLFLLDHHKSAIPLANIPWCEIDVNNDRAGGKMLYDFLMKQGYEIARYKDLVDAADDYDRWVKNIPESETLATLHGVLGQKFFIKRFLKNPDLRLTENEKYILNLENEKREQYIQNAKDQLEIVQREVGGKILRVGYVLANNYQSQLGSAIYSDLELDVDVVVMIGNRSLSLRCRKGAPIDLSTVAKAHGGGGHAAAAGLSLENLLGTSLVEIVKEKLNFDKTI